jgi:hypothetical protein
MNEVRYKLVNIILQTSWGGNMVSKESGKSSLVYNLIFDMAAFLINFMVNFTVWINRGMSEGCLCWLGL